MGMSDHESPSTKTEIRAGRFRLPDFLASDGACWVACPCGRWFYADGERGINTDAGKLVCPGCYSTEE
jgi:hypothetical protein